MYAMSEPLVSISVRADSLSHIQNELASFGLNPNDWRTVQASRVIRSRLILVHRDDSDLRLAVNVQPDENSKNKTVIKDVEMIVF